MTIRWTRRVPRVPKAMEASSVVSTGAGYGRRRKGGAGTPELDELSEQSGFLFDDESEIDDQTPEKKKRLRSCPCYRWRMSWTR